MSYFLRLEFWLFAIPGLVTIAAFLAGPERLRYAGQVIVFMAIVWMILAIAWMFKVILRRLRG